MYINLSHEGCWALFTRGEKWSGRHAADATAVTQGFVFFGLNYARVYYISCTLDAITNSAATEFFEAMDVTTWKVLSNKEKEL